MKILKFEAEKVHGVLDFNIKFNNDLTILTGINGSGKTSVVRSIVSLITPSFINLCYIDYKYMTVEIEHEGEKIKIKSEKKAEHVEFSISNTKEKINIPFYRYTKEVPRFTQYEDEEEYYINLERNLEKKKPISFVRALPTPMFLGLERRVQSEPYTRQRASRRREPLMMRRNMGLVYLANPISNPISKG